MNVDGWGDPVYVKRADGVEPDARRSLLFEQRLLLDRVESERAHLQAGTHGHDPAPPAEILDWCAERLAEVDRRLRISDLEDGLT